MLPDLTVSISSNYLLVVCRVLRLSTVFGLTARNSSNIVAKPLSKCQHGVWKRTEYHVLLFYCTDTYEVQMQRR